ncbi:hypothetical protein R1flu_011112 [Riccia fluitans]|uniref:Uncharacterized protein n=1 Tax=Riccia fluitans TaxID=41844 RepID=A0ABD1Z725_9MARC
MNSFTTPCDQIYDSATDSWSIRFLESAPRPPTNDNYLWTDSTYYKDTFYFLWGNEYGGACELLGFAVEKESWSTIGITALCPSLLEPGMTYFVAMTMFLVCGDRVMIVVFLTIASSSSGEVVNNNAKNQILYVF